MTRPVRNGAENTLVLSADLNLKVQPNPLAAGRLQAASPSLGQQKFSNQVLVSLNQPTCRFKSCKITLDRRPALRVLFAVVENQQTGLVRVVVQRRHHRQTLKAQMFQRLHASVFKGMIPADADNSSGAGLGRGHESAVTLKVPGKVQAAIIESDRYCRQRQKTAAAPHLDVA